MMKTRLQRKGLILLSSLFVLALAGFAVLCWGLGPILKPAAESRVLEYSDGLYRLSIEKLRINLFTGTVQARGLSLTTDTMRWDTLILHQPAITPRKISLSVDALQMTNIRWWHYWMTRHLALDSIVLAAPRLDLTEVKDRALEDAPKRDTVTRSILDQLPRLIAPGARSLRIKCIAVQDARFLLHTKGPEKETLQSADSIHCDITNIHLADTNTTAAGRTLYADSIQFNLRHYRHWSVGHRYLLSVDAAQFTCKDSLLTLQQYSMRSVADDSITVSEPRLQIPRIYCTIPAATIQGLDLFSALHRNEWNVRSVLLDSAYVRLLNNLDLPLPLHRRMPNELWRSLKLPVSVDTLLVSNANIFFYVKADDDKGKLTFLNTNVLALNLNNDSTRMTDTTPARVLATAQFMGTSDLYVALSIPLLSPDFYCPYQATLLNMPLSGINDFLKTKNNLRIEKGFATRISVKAQATNGITRGKVKIYYHDLNISVLKEGSHEKKGIASAIANLVIHHNSDDVRMARVFRTADISYRRQAEDGFLRLLWRAAQNGLVKTLTDVNVSSPNNDSQKKNKQQVN